MPEQIGVVHLVREANGVAPFRSFLDSYRARAAGAAHDLLLIFKGFGPGAEPEEYRAALRGTPYRAVFVRDEGFDIGPYFVAARAFDYRYLCFLNSFSLLLDDDWLAKLYEHVRGEGVGVVGATGSYESAYTNSMRGWPPRRPWHFWLKVMLKHPGAFERALRQRARFPPFPNPHVRTNAFMMARDLMRRIRVGALVSKDDAHRFESGRRGLTRQVAGLGLRPLVVGRDGRAYERDCWYQSFTFRSGGQHNLLVADNQTRHYDEADAATRRALGEAAWGRRRGPAREGPREGGGGGEFVDGIEE